MRNTYSTIIKEAMEKAAKLERDYVIRLVYLHLAGKTVTQDALADALNLDQTTISKIVKPVTDRLKGEVDA